MSRLLRSLVGFVCCIFVAGCDNGEIRDLQEQLRRQEEAYQEQLRQQEQMQEQLRQHEEEIQRLKALVESANKSISALRTSVIQMEAGGYVTSVTPDEQNGTVMGYWLSFGSGETIYLSTGEKSTPRISVRSYNGGNYYWTLDDEFLFDGDGEMIPVEEGASSPLFKTEDGNWYISLDNAASWTLFEKSGAESSVFKAIDTSNKNYVVITLADGTVLQLTTWSAHVTLQNIVNKLNSNLTALGRVVDAINENDYLMNVTPMIEDNVQIGWYFTFSQSGTITIYSIENDGNKDIVKEAVSQTYPDGDPYITGIDTSGAKSVSLLLSDGTTVIVPKHISTSLRIDTPKWLNTSSTYDSYILIGLNETYSCFYHIDGNNLEDATVTAFSDGNCVVSITQTSHSEGYLNITCIREFLEGFVTFLVNDASGQCTTQVIRLVFRTSEAAYYGDPYQLRQGKNFTVPASGGIISTLLPNVWSAIGMNFSALEWAHQDYWRGTNNTHAQIYIDKNTHREDRYVTIDVYSSGEVFSSDTRLESIRIKQEGDPMAEPHPYWEVDYIQFPPQGGEYSITVKTQRGFSMTNVAPCIDYTFSDVTDDSRTVTFSMAPNQEGFGGNTVYIDCGYASGNIHIEQLHQ